MPPEQVLAIIVIFAILAISPFAAVLAAPLVFIKRRYLKEFLIGTAASLLLALVLARPALAHWHDAFAHFRHSRLTVHPRRAVHAAWPSIKAAWVLMIGIGLFSNVLIGFGTRGQLRRNGVLLIFARCRRAFVCADCGYRQPALRADQAHANQPERAGSIDGDALNDRRARRALRWRRVASILSAQMHGASRNASSLQA